MGGDGFQKIHRRAEEIVGAVSGIIGWFESRVIGIDWSGFNFGWNERRRHNGRTIRISRNRIDRTKIRAQLQGCWLNTRTIIKPHLMVYLKKVMCKRERNRCSTNGPHQILQQWKMSLPSDLTWFNSEQRQRSEMTHKQVKWATMSSNGLQSETVRSGPAQLAPIKRNQQRETEKLSKKQVSDCAVHKQVAGDNSTGGYHALTC